MSSGRTWLVMVRDVSHAVEIENEPTVVVCVVLDVDKLEAVIPREAAAPRATCTKGRRSSPPEDCGGIWGYEMAVAANDPANPLHREAREVFTESYGPDFDPSEQSPIPFDIDSINAALHESFT